MNCYGTISNIKQRMGIASSTDDDLLLMLLEAASRSIDKLCHRHFFIENATRYFDGSGGDSLTVDDFLLLTSLATDDDADGVYDDEIWVEGTDWRSWPYNSYPKMIIKSLPNGEYRFIDSPRLVQAVGLWGYGDGSASPHKLTALTGTVATDSGTALTLSTAGVVQAGHTILVEAEQMFVSGVATTTATVERGVNGTTPASHTTKPVSIYHYPSPIVRLASYIAMEAYRNDPLVGMMSETIGDYSYNRVSKTTDTMQSTIDRGLTGFKRGVA